MSKTYGQVLQEECDKRFDSVFLHCDTDGLVEDVARAVILEFVKRVEERASNDLKGRNAAMDYPYTQDVCVRNAFCELSTELKEAK